MRERRCYGLSVTALRVTQIEMPNIERLVAQDADTTRRRVGAGHKEQTYGQVFRAPIADRYPYSLLRLLSNSTGSHTQIKHNMPAARGLTTRIARQSTSPIARSGPKSRNIAVPATEIEARVLPGIAKLREKLVAAIPRLARLQSTGFITLDFPDNMPTSERIKKACERRGVDYSIFLTVLYLNSDGKKV